MKKKHKKEDTIRDGDFASTFNYNTFHNVYNFHNYHNYHNYHGMGINMLWRHKSHYSLKKRPSTSFFYFHYYGSCRSWRE
jgi:hypothetical protein